MQFYNWYVNCKIYIFSVIFFHVVWKAIVKSMFFQFMVYHIPGCMLSLKFLFIFAADTWVWATIVSYLDNWYSRLIALATAVLPTSNSFPTLMPY